MKIISMLRFIMLVILCLILTPTLAYGFQGISHIIFSVAWSPDGSMIAVGSGPQVCNNPDLALYDVKIIDPSTHQVLQTISGNTCVINGLEWSPDGSKLLGVSLDEVYVWNSTTGEVLLENVEGQGFVQAHWKPDGTSIVITDPGGNILILDSDTGEILQTSDVLGTVIDWSPDGNKLVSAHYDSNSLSLISGDDGELLSTLDGHDSVIRAVDWSADGSKIASGSDDGVIKIWDAATGTELLSFAAHTGTITSLMWNADNRSLVTTGVDGKIYVWDTADGQMPYQISAVEIIYEAAWSPDGRQLAYGGEDGVLHIVTPLESLP